MPDQTIMVCPACGGQCKSECPKPKPIASRTMIAIPEETYKQLVERGKSLNDMRRVVEAAKEVCSKFTDYSAAKEPDSEVWRYKYLEDAVASLKDALTSNILMYYTVKNAAQLRRVMQMVLSKEQKKELLNFINPYLTGKPKFEKAQDFQKAQRRSGKL